MLALLATDDPVLPLPILYKNLKVLVSSWGLAGGDLGVQLLLRLTWTFVSTGYFSRLTWLSKLFPFGH